MVDGQKDKRLCFAIRAALADIVRDVGCGDDEEAKKTFVELYEAATDKGYDLGDYKDEYDLFK